MRTTAPSSSTELCTTAQICTCTVCLTASLRTQSFYFSVYPRTEPFVSLRTSTPASSAALRTSAHAPSSVLRTYTPVLWMDCGPLSVLQCTIDCQIHRSDHAPKRSPLINRSAFTIYRFHLDIDLAFQTDHPKFQILRYSNFTSD